jgi:hypothetical protein
MSRDQDQLVLQTECRISSQRSNHSSKDIRNQLMDKLHNSKKVCRTCRINRNKLINQCNSNNRHSRI